MTRVLVVTDSPTQSQPLSAILESAGFEVEVAAEGAVGLERLRHAHFDLVVTDPHLPGSSGSKLCRLIKDDPAGRLVPVVVVTTLTDPMAIVRILECGAANFVTKPYDHDCILRRIEYVLRKQATLADSSLAGGAEAALVEQRVTAENQQALDLLLSTFDELVRASVKREQIDQVKDQFLTRMGHQLRSPLNSIIGFTDTLLMKLSGPLTPAQEQQLATVQESAQHLLSLINQLMDAAKIESGRLELRIGPVSCLDVVREVTKTLRPSAESKGILLDATSTPQDHIIRTDRRAVIEILLNLVGNAIKFTERGQVRIAVGHRANGHQFAEITVSDSGLGIPAADQIRLFQPFAQIATMSGRCPQGSGLGLYLSQKLAGLIGGRITLSSELGKGSRFTMMLPQDEECCAATSLAASAPKERFGTSGERDHGMS